MKKTLLMLVSALSFLVPVSTASAEPCKGCAVAAPFLSISAPATPATSSTPLADVASDPASGGAALFLTLALSAASVGVGLAAVASQRYLRSKTALVKNQAFRELLLTIEDIAFAKFRELKTVVVDNLKAASQDGKLTADEIRALRQTAQREVWRGLTTEQQQQLLKATNQSVEGAYATYIAPALESAVQRDSLSALALNASPKPPTTDHLLAARARINLI